MRDKCKRKRETNLKPKSSSLSNSGQLGGLEMGETEGGQGLVLLSEISQSRDDDSELVDNESESISEEDKIGVAVEKLGERVD